MSTLLCFVAGRSGGHLIPALTLAQHQYDISGKKSLCITTATPLDHAIVGQYQESVEHVPLSLDNIPRNIFKWFIFVPRFIQACIQSYRLLRARKPERIISMGGYISIPVCLMARLLCIPIDVYELNAVPGKATTILSYFSTRILVCFACAKKYFTRIECVEVPYPLRFGPAVKQVSAESIRIKLGLQPNKKTILITGGSQGSRFINTCIKQWITLNPHMHTLVQIIHQTGKAESASWKEYYAQHEIPAIVFEYQHDMAPYYQVADLIICRAGAGSLFEALFFEKHCIVIPLEISSTAHQKDNAWAMKQQYPQLVTVITEREIIHNNTALFSALHKRIYGSAHTAAKNIEIPRYNR